MPVTIPKETPNCPYCGERLDAPEYVDVGPGYEQVTPHHCPRCWASERSPYAKEPPSKYARDGYEPGPGYEVGFEHGKLAHETEKPKCTLCGTVRLACSLGASGGCANPSCTDPLFDVMRDQAVLDIVVKQNAEVDEAAYTRCLDDIRACLLAEMIIDDLVYPDWISKVLRDRLFVGAAKLAEKGVIPTRAEVAKEET